MAEHMWSPAETVAAVVGAAGGVPLIGKAVAYLLRRRDAMEASREQSLIRREADLERREEEQAARLDARARELEAEDRERDLVLTALRAALDRYRLAFEITASELSRVAPVPFALLQARSLLATLVDPQLPADMSASLAERDRVP